MQKLLAYLTQPRSALAATFVLAGCLVIGCQWVSGLHEGNANPVALDARADTGAEVSPSPPSPPSQDAGCGRSPPPPPLDASPSSAGDTLYFVLRDEPVMAEAGVGYDLDCIDTRAADGVDMRCRTRGGANFEDDREGVDNRARTLLGVNGLNFRGTEYAYNVTVGRAGMVIALSGYSGEESDPDVKVGFMQTTGTQAPNGCTDAGPPNSEGVYPPLFNGCDTYVGDPRYSVRVVALERTDGYVTNHTLVVPNPMRVWFMLHLFYVEAQSLAFTAQLRQTPSGFALENGTIGGRVLPEHVLSAMGEQPTPDTDHPTLCRTTNWDALRKQVCRELDLPFADAGAADQLCGALSFALTFSAFPVRFAEGKNSSYEPARTCADAGVSFRCDP